MKNPAGSTSRRWFLLTVGLSCVTLLAIVFSLWELVEPLVCRSFFSMG